MRDPLHWIPVRYKLAAVFVGLCLLAFGVGTILGMAAYAGLASLAVGRAASSLRFARALAYGTSLLSMGVGLWWLVRLSA